MEQVKLGISNSVHKSNVMGTNIGMIDYPRIMCVQVTSSRKIVVNR